LIRENFFLDVLNLIIKARGWRSWRRYGKLISQKPTTRMPCIPDETVVYILRWSIVSCDCVLWMHKMARQLALASQGEYEPQGTRTS
jgi:hypothetical protein